ncbi:MAG: hypothetical protein U9N77_16860 [Thermodesulfobacteriota bacterium]|nr:hypothetical protein [Thermodesulfobacteriota bacterium]
MTMNKKKLAAATAAVFTYIKTEEETASLAVPDRVQVSGMEVKPNVWGSCGRSDLMQIRNMMQMRVFK